MKFLNVQKSVLLLLFVLLSTTACKRESKEIKYINKLRKEHKENPKDIDRATRFETTLREYVLHHPNDTINPLYIYEAAEINMSPLQQYTTAINLFRQIYTHYPKHKLAPDALFRAAFTNDNLLNNKQEAQKQYETFIQNYPEHHLIDDAEGSLKTMHFSEEDLNRHVDSIINAANRNPAM